MDEEERLIELDHTNITNDTFVEMKQKLDADTNKIRRISIIKVSMTISEVQKLCELLTSNHCQIVEFNLESCKMQSRMINLLFEALR